MKTSMFRTIVEAKALPLPNSSLDDVKLARQHVEFAAGANASRIAKVRRLFMATDLVVSAVSSVAVCQKGCSNCCHIDVGITELEAQYIERNAGTKMKKTRPASRTSGHEKSSSPCPFLSATNACTIYEFRPFACRAYFALDDPRFCGEYDTEHVTYDARGNPLLSDIGRRLVELDGHNYLWDIRDLFA